jgi:hypothetical protein
LFDICAVAWHGASASARARVGARSCRRVLRTASAFFKTSPAMTRALARWTLRLIPLALLGVLLLWWARSCQQRVTPPERVTPPDGTHAGEIVPPRPIVRPRRSLAVPHPRADGRPPDVGEARAPRARGGDAPSPVVATVATPGGPPLALRLTRRRALFPEFGGEARLSAEVLPAGSGGDASSPDAPGAAGVWVVHQRPPVIDFDVNALVGLSVGSSHGRLGLAVASTPVRVYGVRVGLGAHLAPRSVRAGPAASVEVLDRLSAGALIDARGAGAAAFITYTF